MSKYVEGLIIVFMSVLFILSIIQIRVFTLLIGMPVETNRIQDPLETDLLSLVSQYKSGAVSVIDISTLTTFPWDQLNIFGPYTDRSELDVMVGRSWRKNCVTHIENSDGVTLLVFSKDGIVVHCLDHPRGENDFYVPPAGYRTGFSPQDALFILDQLGRIVPVNIK